jgi:hypothetical protein
MGRSKRTLATVAAAVAAAGGATLRTAPEALAYGPRDGRRLVDSIAELRTPVSEHAPADLESMEHRVPTADALVTATQVAWPSRA